MCKPFADDTGALLKEVSEFVELVPEGPAGSHDESVGGDVAASNDGPAVEFSKFADFGVSSVHPAESVGCGAGFFVGFGCGVGGCGVVEILRFLDGGCEGEDDRLCRDVACVLWRARSREQR